MQIAEPTKRQRDSWKKWVRALPPKAREVAKRFNPWTLYRLAPHGDRVTIRSFADDGTVTVIVSGKFNAVFFDREVFGVSPDALEECDLPGPGELLGTLMTQQEARDNIDILRVAVRPDLWILDETTGKAIRKQ